MVPVALRCLGNDNRNLPQNTNPHIHLRSQQPDHTKEECHILDGTPSMFLTQRIPSKTSKPQTCCHDCQNKRLMTKTELKGKMGSSSDADQFGNSPTPLLSTDPPRRSHLPDTTFTNEVRVSYLFHYSFNPLTSWHPFYPVMWSLHLYPCPILF